MEASLVKKKKKSKSLNRGNSIERMDLFRLFEELTAGEKLYKTKEGSK